MQQMTRLGVWIVSMCLPSLVWAADTTEKTFPSKIYDKVVGMADFLLNYAIALAAVGALTMALIEGGKTLFRIRDGFHQRALKKFLGTAQAEGAAHDAYTELLHLATGQPLIKAAELKPAEFTQEREPRNALFTLELERMMSPIQDAADTAISYPDLYPSLYGFLVEGASEKDRKIWKSTLSKLQGIALEDLPEGVEPSSAAAVYGRLSKLAKRRLDSFQLGTSFRWKELNQLCSYLLGFVILLICLVSVAPKVQEWQNGALIFVASLIGGVLAPIAKDVVVALQRVRSGE